MLIEIDAPSVILFAGVSVVIALGMGLAFDRHIRRDPAIHWLNGANLFYLVGVVAILIRPEINLRYMPLLAAAGAYGGMCCAFFAVLRTEDRKPPIAPLTLIGLASLAAQAALSGAPMSMLTTSSVINGALTFYMMVTVWRLMRLRGLQIAILVTLPFSAFFGGYSLRLISLIGAPDTEWPMVITVLIVTILAWSAVVLQLGVIAIRERQARRELRDALTKVEAAAEAKSRFLLGVSHELRTPLNGVIGLSELIRTEALGPTSAAYREFATNIHESGQRMLDLVTDLLDIAAMATGGAKLTNTSVDLPAILPEIKNRFKLEAASRNVRFRVEASADAPLHAAGDCDGLRRMLSHLAENAIKYAAENGEVLVRLSRAENGGATFTVMDDGVGMTEPEIAVALELFGRVNGVENAENGSGVGLTLAREIARAHGARFTIDSTPGHGTTITIDMPPAAGADGAAAPIESEARQGPRDRTLPA